jgi:hypothetical protein
MDHACRAAILNALAPFGRAPWTEELLEIALSLEYPDIQLEALDRLAPNLRGNLLDLAIEHARGLWDDLSERFCALCACIPLLSPKIQREALERAVEAARDLPGSIVCSRIAALAHLMPDELRRPASGAAVRSTLRLAHPSAWSWLTKARMLSDLEPILEGGSRQDEGGKAKALLSNLREMEEPALFQPALVLVSPYLDNDELSKWPWYSTQDALAIMKQAAAETDAQAAAALREAALIALVSKISPDHFRAMALLGIAPRLSEASLGPALDIAASITYYPSGRCDARQSRRGAGIRLPDS